MKKIVVLSGSPRKHGHTMGIVERIKENIKMPEEFVYEYIHLYDYTIKGCIGCKVCIIKDGNACPFKDDVLEILQKLESADGIIFASPTYSRAVSGPFKNFIDRTNYVLHRPNLVGIPSIMLATTDIGMANKVTDYLGVIASSMGSRVEGQLAVKMGAMTNDQRYIKSVEKDIIRISDKFKISVLDEQNLVPTMGQLLRFNVWKTRAIITQEKYPNDYTYWKERGWIEEEFFYKTKITPIKRIVMKILVKRIQKMISKGVLY